MSLLERVTSVVPRSPRRVPTWARVAAVPTVAVTVAAGVWVAGAALTESATVAMVLTGLWFGLAGAAALGIGLRWRALALPVIATYAATTLALGGFLAYASSIDRVVDEQVTVASPGMENGVGSGTGSGMGSGMGTDAGTGAEAPEAGGPARTAVMLVASGSFVSGAHETSGTAQVLERPGGARVLTLTGFETDPGPDLRVYVVPGVGSDVSGAVDVGALKGNVGDQEYELPAGTAAGAVVIWCRAFSVSFGTAALA